MANLSSERIAALLRPFLIAHDAPGGDSVISPLLLEQLSVYLDLLLRWNARVSLTAIREPEEIVRRHFGESLFTARHLAEGLRAEAELLDYGSGAGFPGLPIQLFLPSLRVTLAESQAKKVAFLREVVRTLSLPTEVWPRRVGEMPAERSFDVVTLRAVDRMEVSLEEAQTRVRGGGRMAILAGGETKAPAGSVEYRMPESEQRRLFVWNSSNVPRGTSAVISTDQ